jgi:hypothetical protein
MRGANFAKGVIAVSSSAQIKHEIASLLNKSLVGDASEADLRELNQLIKTDKALIKFVADVLGQEAWLSWTIARNRSGSVRRDLTGTIIDSLHPDLIPPGNRDVVRPESCVPLAAVTNLEPPPRRFYGGLALAACLLLIAGTLLGTLGTLALTSRRPKTQIAEISRDAPDLLENNENYTARVVNATSCRWSTDVRFPVQDNGILRKGESLQLMEGIAEVSLEWPQGTAKLRIEGPAGLVLTADHGCSLSHGKLTADINTNDSLARFSIETPNGLVELADGSSCGIIVDGRDVSVHAFQAGQQIVLKPWSTDSTLPDLLPLEAGQSLTLVAGHDGELDVEHGESRSSIFASQVSMYSDALTIPEEYVTKVRSRNPLVYWRFDDRVSNEHQVKNDMSDRYAGQIFGSVQFRERNGNQFIEFGASSQIDSTLPRVEAQECFENEVSDEYSLEVWIKPNHFHQGTMVAFVDDEPIQGPTGIIESAHGLLLEIGGPRTRETSIEQPGKIRYLHRSPPNTGRIMGSTCFSDLAYEPRHWHHLVVVKKGPEMQIYLNGQLTGVNRDETQLAPGLRLLVGQLDRWRSARMYVGQLDELAFYPSALTADQIREHFELVRRPTRLPKVESLIKDIPVSDAI